MTRRRFFAAAGAPLLAAPRARVVLIHGDADVEGLRFPNTFHASGSRDACLSVLYTGLYNHANGQYGERSLFGHFALHPHVRTMHDFVDVDDRRRDTPHRNTLTVVYGRELVLCGDGLSGVGEACANEADVLPTVLDWAGIAPPYPLHGRSLLRRTENDYSFFSQTFTTIDDYNPVRGVRTREYEYRLSLLPGGEETLKPVPDAGVLRELRAATEHFRRRTADPWLSTAPYIA
jgi:hypothetical protein